ncbi:MAG: hypothetical protein A2W25_15025 [candidate division Zixibacteria bacterium RBG_16_53_22]|nr:MAG: hypothetical protein A2W25_15025 [candidate division Zixibacteria bacterium RBG_16_53_22]
MAAVADFDQIAGTMDLPYFLIGATARDIIYNAMRVPSPRMTQDIDLAVSISDWDTYDKLSSSMLASGKFGKNKTPRHRHFHLTTNIPIDILPFGSIDGGDFTIHWPDPDHTSMSTLGFEEAFKSAIETQISINPNVTIKVSSAPGLAIMKLIAWSDNSTGRARHALDLLHLIRNYLDPVNELRLYDEHSDLMEIDDFDFECAGARLMGRDIASLASPQVLTRINDILTGETQDECDFKLLIDMAGHPVESEYRHDEILKLLRSLRDGVRDARKSRSEKS